MGGLRSTQRAEWQCRLNTLFTAPTSHGKKSGKSDEYPGKFFSDDGWLVIQSLADEVGEQQRQADVTETSVSRVEDSTGGVGGGEGGVVQLVHGEDGVLSGGSGVATQVGENRAEGKTNAANPLAPSVENKRNRNGVPVTWDGATVTTTNIVSQPRNRERTRPNNFRSGAFLVTIAVPYREATASGKFNESRFEDRDKHLKLGAIIERHISEKPPGEPLVPTRRAPQRRGVRFASDGNRVLEADLDSSLESGEKMYSRTGGVAFLAGGPVAIRATTQKHLATGTQESETYAASEVLHDLEAIRNVVKSLPWSEYNSARSWSRRRC
eukprot:g7797.t1